MATSTIYPANMNEDDFRKILGRRLFGPRKPVADYPTIDEMYRTIIYEDTFLLHYPKLKKLITDWLQEQINNTSNKVDIIETYIRMIEYISMTYPDDVPFYSWYEDEHIWVFRQ